MSPFFAYLHRLRFIRRWSLMRNTEPENVAEHSFQVAILTHALTTIASRVFGRSVDVNRATTLALFHDVEEVFTGDIATPVKHHNPALLRSLREMEVAAGEQLLTMLPPSLQPEYRELIRHTAAEPDLTVWVKAADKLAAYLKCVTETATGNREFAVALRQTEATVRSLNMPEVDYFLEHFAGSFAQTLDEISE